MSELLIKLKPNLNSNNLCQDLNKKFDEISSHGSWNIAIIEIIKNTSSSDDIYVYRGIICIYSYLGLNEYVFWLNVSHNCRYICMREFVQNTDQKGHTVDAIHQNVICIYPCQSVRGYIYFYKITCITSPAIANTGIVKDVA